MSSFWVSLLLAPIAALLAIGGLPSRRANAGVKTLRLIVTGLLAFQLAGGLVAGVGLLLGSWPSLAALPLAVPPSGSPHAVIYFDGLSALMLTLVSFVGWIICRYSIRYLDGDPQQGRYFRWTALTVGGVSLMVIAGNLALLLAAWGLTSAGLHALLLHYPERPGARRAAWTKFAFSRAGDLSLLAALALIYQQFGTSDLATLFALCNDDGSWAAQPAAMSPAIHGIAWLLVLGAVLKTAQFPFHTWLPQTLETPTPVSALMHAGIVNGGGYLLIRLSPLLHGASGPLMGLVVVGTLTAVLGSIIMLTQTSIKRSLAYSTVAQMGFMMLQCGLGAYSAAMLHIVAHSLYKAHAFLGSGGVLAQRAGSHAGRAELPLPANLLRLTAALASVMAIGTLAASAFAWNPAAKPGGTALALVIGLALTNLLWQALVTARRSLTAVGILLVAVLSASYVVAYGVVDTILHSNPAIGYASATSMVATSIVLAGFLLLLALQVVLLRRPSPDWLKALYVHASNGFYADLLWHRVAGMLAHRLPLRRPAVDG